PAEMLEDQRRLGARDIGVGIEVLDHEGPQVFGIAGRDVQDEIVGTGKEVDIHHLRLAPNLLDEIADPAAGAGLQVDRNHGLQRQSDGDRIKVGVEAADYAKLHQP